MESNRNQRDAFLVNLNEATQPLIDPDETLQTSVRLLAEHLGFDSCCYCTFDEDTQTFTVAQAYTRPGTTAMAGRYSLNDFGAEFARLLRGNLPHIVTDSESEACTDDQRAVYRQAGVRAAATAPLHKAGTLVAVMGLHHHLPRTWLPDEIELVRLVADRCWELIERGRVTRALEESEQRLRLAQRAGRIGTFEWVMNENRITWTPENEALFGLPEGGFEGRLEDWTKRVVPEDARRVLAQIDGCVVAKASECSFDFRAVLPDGKTRWLRGHATITYDPAGAVERMIGVNMDIDAQKKAEAHLLQQWHTFDTALSHTPDFTYTLDLEGRFSYANRALLSLYQMPLDDVIGRNFFDLNYPGELAERLQSQIQQVIHTRRPVRDETPYAGPTGETRLYEYIFVPVIAPEGEVEAVTGSTRDITDLKRTQEEERLRQARLLETARLESLGVMAGGIAHDFNNLLTGILGNASLLADDIEGEDRTIAAQIVLAAERAADLTRQLLAFSGKGRYITQVLDLNAIVSENLVLLRSSLSRNITINLELSSDTCSVEADRGQLQQVIMNLIINASEAVGDEAGNVAIRTGVIERALPEFSARLQYTVPAGCYAFLEIRDTGSGIPPDTLKKIFDPFFTTKFTGRGLGLAAVLGIVKGHRGDIEVISEPERGTTFRVYLPAAEMGETAR